MVFALNYPIIISFVEKPPSLDDLHFQKRLYVIKIIQDQAKKRHEFYAQFLKISKFSACFKSGLSVYLSGVVAWTLYILIGQGAAD
jgi:hypothetical protein